VALAKFLMDSSIQAWDSIPILSGPKCPTHKWESASFVPIRDDDGSPRNVETQLLGLLKVAISRIQHALGFALGKYAVLAGKRASK
jgi:hypothetical protein